MAYMVADDFFYIQNHAEVEATSGYPGCKYKIIGVKTVCVSA